MKKFDIYSIDNIILLINACDKDLFVIKIKYIYLIKNKDSENH